MRRTDRRGMVLLETVVALTVLATIGSVAAWSASESFRAVNRAHEREALVRRADQLFTAVSLWTREDLDRHLGTRTQGPFRMRLDRTAPRIYQVSLLDGPSGQLILQTSLYRPERKP